MTNNFYKKNWVSAAIIDNMEDPIFITDDKGIIVYVNDFLVSSYGYSKEELVGKPRTFFYVDKKEKCDSFLNGEVWNGKEIVRSKNGELISIRLNLQPLKNIKGKIEGYVSFHRDLTEINKEKEQALLSEDNYRKIFNSAPRLITFVYESGILKDCNDRIEEILGYKKEEVIGKNIEMFFPYDYLDKFKNHLALLMKQGSETEHEYKMMKKNGEIIDITMKSSIGKDKKGRKHTICFIADITEIKQDQENLVKEKEKAQKYLDIAGVIFIVINMEGNVVLINKKGCEVLGYNESEIIGKNWFNNFIPERTRFNLSRVQEIMLKKNKKFEYYENEILTKNGEERIIAWHNNLLQDDDGNIIGSLSSGEDITNRKKVEEQIIQRTEELKRSNEELEQFAYVSSHDLQEPVRVISSYCQLLKEKNYEFMDDEGKKYMDYAIDASSRMRTLIKELLDYSRVGRKDRPFEKINLNELVAEGLKDFEFSIKETEATIIVEGDMPIVSGIKFRVKQLFHNIISNSLKFKSDAKPIIRIGCCDDPNEDHFLFYINDNGLGIDKKYYDRVFQIFKRLYTREEYPGTGIGLALCKRIVEAHGGTIWLESNLGKGTCIYFTISKKIHKG